MKIEDDIGRCASLHEFMCALRAKHSHEDDGASYHSMLGQQECAAAALRLRSVVARPPCAIEAKPHDLFHRLPCCGPHGCCASSTPLLDASELGS